MSHERLYQGFQHSSAKDHVRPTQVEESPEEPKPQGYARPLADEDDNDSMNQHRENTPSKFPPQPSAVSGSIGCPENVDKREHTLGQNQMTGTRLETKVADIDQLAPEYGRSRKQLDRSISSDKAQKYLPGADVAPPDIAFDGCTTRNSRRGPRHAQVPSSGFLPTSPDLNRQNIQSLDPQYRRTISGAKQALWNPDKDSVKVSGVARKGYTPVFVNLSQQLRSSKEPHIAPEESESSERDHWPPKHHPFQRRALNDQIDLNVNETEVKSHNLEGQMLASGGPLPDDDGDDLGSPGAEPEILLQPETRSISDEQLVIEVKGIYAGLVMVEAKCIDIDERQSVAAQEKDPAKRIDLKDG
ncbi:hypothetical protein MMC28_007220 [Mycoblastus sanguinarius]|nr:hypothetical protein [Mycoblastus sanguinarius]